MKILEKFHRWVATVRRRVLNGPPLIGQDSLQALADDVRKLGLGAMGAGFLGLFVPSANASPGAFVAVLLTGAIIWLSGIALNAHLERQRTGKKD